MAAKDKARIRKTVINKNDKNRNDDKKYNIPKQT